MFNKMRVDVYALQSASQCIFLWRKLNMFYLSYTYDSFFYTLILCNKRLNYVWSFYFLFTKWLYIFCYHVYSVQIHLWIRSNNCLYTCRFIVIQAISYINLSNWMKKSFLTCWEYSPLYKYWLTLQYPAPVLIGFR